MITTLLGSLLGFGSAIVPSVVDHFKAKQDQKFELEKMQKAAELRAAGYTQEMNMYEAKATDEEHERLIEHDIATSKGTGFITALQRSVRPVITYCFFGLFTVIEITLLYHAIDTGMNFVDAIQILWDDDTKGIFAAIMSFWFGSRQLDKHRKNNNAK